MSNENRVPAMVPQDDDDSIDILSVVMALLRRWPFLVASAILGVGVGLLAASWPRDSYTSDILLQVDEEGSNAGLAVGEMGELLDMQSPAEAEIALIKSRMVLAPVVTEVALRYSAVPDNKFDRLLRREGRMDLEYLQLPSGEKFRARAVNADKFEVLDPDGSVILRGAVGKVCRAGYHGDSIAIWVKSMDVRGGETFALRAIPVQMAIADLQKRLSVEEVGKKSGVLQATITCRYPDECVSELNSVANMYVHQNVEKHSAEAAKTLAFLEQQLPAVKAKVDSAEGALTAFRDKNGSVDLNAETRLLLDKKTQLQQQLIDLEQKKKDAQRLFRDDHPEVQTIASQERALLTSLSQLNVSASGLPVMQQNYMNLQENVDVNNNLYTTLLNNMQQLRVARAGEVGNVRVVDYAEPALAPTKPRRSFIFAGCVAGALFLCCLLIFLERSFHRGMKRAMEIESATGLSVYAKLPKIPGLPKGSPVISPYVMTNPDRPFSEGIRALRTALDFSVCSKGQKVIMVTGIAQGVGKSLITVNLAASFAMIHKKTLLVEADIRRGSLRSRRAKGLSDVLLRGASVAEALFSNHECLDVLGAGMRCPNPGDLLSSDVFASFMKEMRSQYDVIVIDTPPVAQCSDALLIEHCADFSLCVLKYAVHREEDVQDLLSSLDRAVSVPLPKAFALNMYEHEGSGYGYYHRYGYGYGYRDKDN